MTNSCEPVSTFNKRPFCLSYFESCNLNRVKAGTHETTNRSNILLQQIALSVQSSDKSYALIAAIGFSDKSPGVNASTFDGKLIRILSPRQILLLQYVAQNQTSLILCNMLQRQNSVAATKFSIKSFCSHDEICCCDVLQRFVVSCVPAFKRKQHIFTATLARERYRFPKSSVLALSLQNHKDLNVKSLVYVSGLRNNCLHATRLCYTTVLNCDLMSRGKHLNFQHSFWGVIQEVTNHCMWTITLVGVILCDKRILLERELPYTLKSANKQLTHTFLHFVASLQRRFYILAPISVLYLNIYSSRLRLCKTDLLVSLSSISNPWTMFNFSVVFAVKLASRYICFKYLDCVKRVIFQASDMAKILRINVLVIL